MHQRLTAQQVVLSHRTRGSWIPKQQKHIGDAGCGEVISCAERSGSKKLTKLDAGLLLLVIVRKDADSIGSSIRPFALLAM